MTTTRHKKTKPTAGKKKKAALADRAMLVRLQIRRWTGRRIDRKVTAQVNAAQHASDDAGTYHKALVAKTALEQISKLTVEIRHWHYDNTLPWTDDGARLLPGAHFSEYSKKIREFTTGWEAALNDFVGAFSSYVTQSKQRLGKMFDESEYPVNGSIRERFGLEISIDPIPTAGDFRLELTDTATAKIKREITKRLEQASTDAMADLWKRLFDVVEKIAGRLSEPKAIFRDSLIGNASELCRLLTTLNVTDDANLEKMRQEVESKLAQRQPDDIRDDKAERRDAAKAADEIAKQMGGFMKSAKPAKGAK